MADKRIDQFSTITSLESTDWIPVGRGTLAKKINPNNFFGNIRIDSKSNVVDNTNGQLASFPFDTSGIENNTILGGRYTASSNTGVIKWNNVRSNAILQGAGNSGTVQENSVECEGVLDIGSNAGTFSKNRIGPYTTVTVQMASGGNVQNCIFDLPGGSIVFSGNESYSGKVVRNGYSDFDYSDVVTGLTSYDLGIARSGYVGIVTLTTTNTTESLSTLLNLPTRFPIRFYASSGKSITFVHGTGSNQPQLKGYTDVTINGTNGEWIEFFVKAGKIYENARGANSTTGDVRIFKTTLTDAQFKAISTPYDLVPAQGVNKRAIPIPGTEWIYKAGTGAGSGFDFTGNIVIGNSIGETFSMVSSSDIATTLGANGPKFIKPTPSFDPSPLTLSAVANKAIQIYTDDVDATTGSGSVTIGFLYIVQDVS